MGKQIFAPWSDEQVAGLNQYQRHGRFHPFTCGNDRGDAQHRRVAAELGDRDLGLLRATRDGWTCPACDYKQAWAWAWMAEDHDA